MKASTAHSSDPDLDYAFGLEPEAYIIDVLREAVLKGLMENQMDPILTEEGRSWFNLKLQKLNEPQFLKDVLSECLGEDEQLTFRKVLLRIMNLLTVHDSKLVALVVEKINEFHALALDSFATPEVFRLVAATFIARLAISSEVLHAADATTFYLATM